MNRFYDAAQQMAHVAKRTSLVWIPACMFLCLTITLHAKQSPAESPTESPTESSSDTPAVTRAERGITRVMTFRYAGPRLRVKTLREVDAPLLARLVLGDQPQVYEARFIGAVPGAFDLRELIEHADGSIAEDLAPMPIEIFSTLPSDQRSDLFDASGYRPTLSGGYRLWLILAILAWLAVPATVIWRRIFAKPKEVLAPPVAPPPTLLEQLRPLIQSATDRQLSTGEQARLELLLLHYWRERAGLPTLNMAEAIQRLRSHAEAGPLIRAVEQWLHHRQDSAQLNDNQRSPEAILQLLQQVVP